MHSSSSPNSHSSGFTVAGMSGSTSSTGQNSWSNPTTGPSSFGVSLSDSLNQSRAHYQPGYLMSASQSSNLSQSGQRYDDAPVVQTKAKMNHVLSRGSTTDFGTDSMFESSRSRQALADEDAPPMASINDIINEMPPDSSSSRFQSKHQFSFGASSSRPFFPHKSNSAPSSSLSQSHSGQNQTQPLYVIVFGYPPDKYTATLEYLRSLGGDVGETTEPTQNTQIVNCFKLGFNNPADAVRAVRKNGEVLGGCWMIGVKWADQAQAEAVLGSSLARSAMPAYDNYTQPTIDSQKDTATPMAVDDGFQAKLTSPNGGFPHTPTVGTPIKLAPSGSAFKKMGHGSVPRTAQNSDVGNKQPQLQHTPSKSVIGQVSDMVFGW